MFKMRFLGLLALALMAVLVVLPAGHALAATWSTLHPNDGTTYFLLNNTLNFSNTSGTGIYNDSTTDLDASTIQNSVINTFQHTLFTMDSSGNVTVSSSGFDSPVTAQVSQNSDGSNNIVYSFSTQALTESFNGTLSGDQMTATYEQQTIGGATVNNQEYLGGTNITASFTTTVNWVTADQIPAAPTNGQYQLSSDGGVILSWTASTSGNVSGYNVYRMVVGVDKEPQLQGTTTDASYTDESSLAIQNAQSLTGIIYTVYAVGPTGIENPTDVALYVAENPMDVVNSIPSM